MKKKFIVAGKDLNFTLKGTRCISGQIVELDPNDHVVGTHISQGDITAVTEKKEVVGNIKNRL